MRRADLKMLDGKSGMTKMPFRSFFVASAKKKTTSGAGEREKLKIQETPPLL